MAIELRNRAFSPSWFKTAATYMPDFMALRKWFESEGLEIDGERAANLHAFRLLREEHDTGLVISTRANEVCMCYIATCYWATYEHEDHPKGTNLWNKEYDQFNAEYSNQLKRTCSDLGPPIAERIDLIHEDFYEIPSYIKQLHSASWILGDCTLILQQTAYDTQFGLEINYWLHPQIVDIKQSIALPVNWLEGNKR